MHFVRSFYSELTKAWIDLGKISMKSAFCVKRGGIKIVYREKKTLQSKARKYYGAFDGLLSSSTNISKLLT